MDNWGRLHVQRLVTFSVVDAILRTNSGRSIYVTSADSIEVEERVEVLYWDLSVWSHQILNADH